MKDHLNTLKLWLVPDQIATGRLGHAPFCLSPCVLKQGIYCWCAQHLRAEHEVWIKRTTDRQTHSLLNSNTMFEWALRNEEIKKFRRISEHADKHLDPKNGGNAQLPWIKQEVDFDTLWTKQQCTQTIYQSDHRVYNNGGMTAAPHINSSKRRSVRPNIWMQTARRRAATTSSKSEVFIVF